MARLVALAFAGLVGALVWLFAIVSLVLLLFGGVGLFVVPAAFAIVRGLTSKVRCQLAIADPSVAAPHGRVPRRGVRGRWDRCLTVLGDPAMWRDLLWLLLNGLVGPVICLTPLVLIAAGAAAALAPVAVPLLVASYPVLDAAAPFATAWVSVPVALLSVGFGVWSSPRVLRAYAAASKLLLAPTRRRVLDARVRQLADRRAVVLDAQAAELRRIERDLHDGAQGRLVALGLQLAAAEQMLERDPASARGLIADGRELATSALSQLRDLARAIHPPVLADRGLAEALRGLALESPLRVDVAIALPGRLRAPVESAAYFAVSEALTNAAKHGRGEHASLNAWQDDGMLRLLVVDDGCGGADVKRGTGLQGIARRLAAFDGAIDVDSPAGGPTRVRMEVPCDSSSPKISSS